MNLATTDTSVTRAGTPRITKETWRALMQAWEFSGQSQAEFCKSQGVNKHTFGYWRSKFLMESNSLSSMPPKLLEIRSTSDATASNEAVSVPVVKVQSPTGLLLSVPSCCGAEFIAALVNRLGDIHA